jgi:hypothetical protein
VFPLPTARIARADYSKHRRRPIEDLALPAKLNNKRNWIPAAVILGTTAALIALDSHDAPISGALQHSPVSTEPSQFRLVSG